VTDLNPLTVFFFGGGGVCQILCCHCCLWIKCFIKNPTILYLPLPGIHLAQISKQEVKRIKILLGSVPSDSVPLSVKDETKYSRNKTPIS
jgi:hypothetical protein